MPCNPKTSTSSRALQQHLFSLLRRRKCLPQIHTQIIINAYADKNFLLAKLLSSYLDSGHLIPALCIFQGLESPSTTVWNQIIRSHARGETPHKSVQLFNQMVGTGVEPDGFTYSFVLSGCAKLGSVIEGEQLHGRAFSTGHCSNVFVSTSLVNMYGNVVGGSGMGYARKVFDEMRERNAATWNTLLAGHLRCGEFDLARKLFDEMPERNVVSWTAMIAGHARSGKCKYALILFDKMRKDGVELDQVVLVAALSACAEIGDLKLGKWIHSYVTESFSSKNKTVLVSLNNALIHMYASCGMIEEAYEVFRWMPERTVVSWTSLIVAFAKQGYADQALSVFNHMQTLGSKEAKPDELTFIGVLVACSHGGYVNQGRQFFEDMRRIWGISPTIEHYGCLVDLYSRAGLLDEASELIKTMPMKPNDAVWGALLGGCRIHKSPELASQVARLLIGELDPDRAAGYLVLLAHVFASDKRWQEVAAVRQKMVEIGARKPAGRSWVEVNGSVHEFIAGGWSHENASSIYGVIDSITDQSKPEEQEHKSNVLMVLPNAY
ncbi:Pentatricopeptide repeat-containing protein At5g56310 [Linum perenne]